MDFEIVTIPEIKVCGLSVKLTNYQSQNYKIISNHWITFNRKLKGRLKSSGGNWEKYGLTYKLDSTYYYMPAVKLIESSDFDQITIKGGQYARFQHKGDMKDLKEAIYNIYKVLLPNSKLEIDPNRTILHFERYDHRFKWNRTDSIIEIYLPIEAEAEVKVPSHRQLELF